MAAQYVPACTRAPVAGTPSPSAGPRPGPPKATPPARAPTQPLAPGTKRHHRPTHARPGQAP
eukprot:9352449-Alexandrium_andersonii.AAC.1